MRKPIAVGLFALMLAACAPGYDPIPGPTTTTQPAPVGTAEAELAAARDLWASVGSGDYTYQFQNDCGECDPDMREPRRIAVLGGEVLTVEEDTGLLTVEEVFARVEQAIDASREVEVNYDPQTGFPRDVQIDMDQRPFDGGIHWVLSDPTELTPIDSGPELADARRLWEAQQLDDYRFLIKVDCDCPEAGTFDVKVIDDRVVEVIPLDLPAETSPIDPTTINQAFDDFEEWFAETQTLFAEGILEVDIRVDPVIGYPRWVLVKADFTDNGVPAPFEAVVTMDLVTPLDPEVEPGEPDAGALAALQRARELWGAGRVTDYQYTLTVHCLCPEEHTGPFEITVRDQRVISATWQGNPLGADQGAAYTIEEVFEMIEAAIRSGIEVDVTYDPLLGHPHLVIIDVEAVAVDGGLAFTIDNLTRPAKPGGVVGQVLAGPTCPVEKDPPDPACADRAVEGAILVVFDPQGQEVTRVTSNPNGYFEISLEPGTYRIEPQPVAGLLGTAAPFELEIVPGVVDQVTVSYATGIR